MVGHFSSLSLLGVGVLLVGCLLLYLGVRSRKLALRSLAWPKVPGTITQSAVRIERRSGGENSGDTTTHRVEIAYDYKVGERSLTGRRVRSGGTEYSSAKAAEKTRDLYPVGRVVEVAYDPNRPDSAILEPGNAAGTRVFWILGVIFALLGAVVAVVGLGMAG